ncbi:MAG: TonB-dependent receptor, partial [Gemmatimonadaceae bacterium]|nr:TonB-dependent receptor [Gloeobacterales cyanobacterium ES-bin-141]
TTTTTYVVTKEDFRAQGAQTVTEALQLVPGFDGNIALGGLRNAAGIFLRGFDDQRFQILRDGLALTRSSNNRNDASGFVVNDLERIEVVSGGATLRYGSGAVGGVINLITETPKGPPKLTASFQTGSYGFTTYIGKYGGGDDTLSYNFTYQSLSAFNDYPYSFSIPNTANFYGPTTNPDAAVPVNAVDPSIYPNGENSFGVGGADAGDARNNGPIDLFGFLSPEIGPALKIQGRADRSFVFSDNYTAKLSAKPDAVNRVTLRLQYQAKKNDGQGPGLFALGTCLGGQQQGLGTLDLERFLPLGRNGNELPCDTQRYIPNTPTNLIAFPYNYNTNFDGTIRVPTGNPLAVENNTADIFFNAVTLQNNLDVALFHDLDITPTTSLNSYLYYFKFDGRQFRPSPYSFNTNLLGNAALYDAPPGSVNNLVFARAPGLSQPYFEGARFEAQTALNTQLSPGQTLSFGVNFVEDRSYQQKTSGTTFFDRAIARSSFFLVDDISFSEQLKANLGLRYTYSTQFGVVATPGAGVRFSPSSLISLRANFSQVYNAASISDLTVGGAPPFLANPNLSPETGVTYDAGIDITPSRNLSFRATYFNTYLDGFISTVTFPNLDPATNQSFPFLQQQQNASSRLATGIEFVGDWQATERIRLRTTWTNTDARNYGPLDNINDANFPFFYQYQDPNIPFNRVRLNALYQGDGYLVSLLGGYASGFRRGADPFSAPSFATLDVSVEIPVSPNFTITGNVFNATDTQYQSAPNVPAPGTTFRVGGRLELGGAAPEAQ